ncbi:hypothetical protein J2S55_008829 [Streptosporangium brasiliense]|uniref:Uncharacterized protein n=1 Tax=Streptosporangium brasiliense TaxID=47480 RepID=A0ABT9RJT8_9ACTN|nr:hypothetical protein [Streptosporangium brasiliense]
MPHDGQKNIGSVRLYRPDGTPPGRPALGGSLTRPIRWKLISQQYGQRVKYATTLRLGTAETRAESPDGPSLNPSPMGEVSQAGQSLACCGEPTGQRKQRHYPPIPPLRHSFRKRLADDGSGCDRGPGQYPRRSRELGQSLGGERECIDRKSVELCIRHELPYCPARVCRI